MNMTNIEDWDKALPIKLMKAVQDPEKWGDVLELIMQITGAKAAIITLRDKHNCQIVNDDRLEQDYHSPLIRGFSTDAIVHYLTNLRTIDPWADFQRTHYPYRPMQMTRVCPTQNVPDQRFFDWLGDLGFQDSIVFELDRMAGYWTAINLFLETPSSPEAQRTLDFCNENYDLLRTAWVASQNLLRSRQSNAALLDRAAGAGSPVCVVSANGEMLECNDLFQDVLAADAVRLSGSGRKLSFAPSVSVFGMDSWAQHGFLRHDAETPALTLLASPIDPDPLFAEKRETLWLLSSTSKDIAMPAKPPTQELLLDTLTPQERALFNHVKDGKSIVEAGDMIGLKRSRTFEVWSSVRTKLGLKNAHALRG